MLVRGRVEDDLGPVALEDLAHLRLVLDVAEIGMRGGEAPLVHELALDLEQRRLGVVDEDEARGAEVRDLAAELGADRPAGAGDEHGLAGEVRRDGLEVDLDRLAAEHVLHLDGTDLRGEVEVAGDELVACPGAS